MLPTTIYVSVNYIPLIELYIPVIVIAVEFESGNS